MATVTGNNTHNHIRKEKKISKQIVIGTRRQKSKWMWRPTVSSVFGTSTGNIDHIRKVRCWVSKIQMFPGNSDHIGKKRRMDQLKKWVIRDEILNGTLQSCPHFGLFTTLWEPNVCRKLWPYKGSDGRNGTHGVEYWAMGHLKKKSKQIWWSIWTFPYLRGTKRPRETMTI